MTAKTKSYIYLTIAAWSLAYLTTYPQFTELLVKAIT